MIRIFSVGIRSIPHLEVFLGTSVGFGLAGEGLGKADAVAGWGLRSSANKAIRYAKQMQLPYLALEDGFLRSVGLGKSEPPLSIVVDDLGIYYDANRLSRLEFLIDNDLTTEQVARARQLMALWRQERVSKYNQLRELVPNASDDASSFSLTAESYVLVVDQTKGDASIRYGQASSESFHRMLQAALDEYPECTILLKIHPDVATGKKKGHFDCDKLRGNPRVKLMSGDIHPAGLIENAFAVYTVTSQMGFEALIWGKPVRTFGMPFYAGWGLTKDELSPPSRRGACTLEQLVHAALVDYPRYVHPETGAVCDVEDILSYLGLQRRMRERFADSVHALSFSPYKRRVLRRFFAGSDVNFIQRRSRLPVKGTLAVWGCKDRTLSCEMGALEPLGSDIIHLEDGFLRSVGLGADLIYPVSWVMDKRGIYYDATRPSDLEHLLQTTDFDSQLCTRASRLRSRIVIEGLTKYNVGDGRWSPPAREGLSWSGMSPAAYQMKVILVPGQVESDASIHYGASTIRTNVELLRAVREAHPNDYILYKPHPDVVSGLRAPGKDEAAAISYCNEVVKDISMHELLGQVDEVHVLTSLSGFEALLRGRAVTTYGQPFYAGWGLTRDLALTPEVARRRTRRLTLEQLVAGTLILYPTYVSRTTGRFTTPERVLDELLNWRDRAPRNFPLWRWPLRLALQAWGGRR